VLSRQGNPLRGRREQVRGDLDGLRSLPLLAAMIDGPLCGSTRPVRLPPTRSSLKLGRRVLSNRTPSRRHLSMALGAIHGRSTKTESPEVGKQP
jgi:hypothetical protein